MARRSRNSAHGSAKKGPSKEPEWSTKSAKQRKTPKVEWASDGRKGETREKGEEKERRRKETRRGKESCTAKEIRDR